MSEKMVDARGLSCPEPVLMAQQMLKESGKAAFVVRVSSPTARDNVTAAMQAKGRTVTAVEDGEDWRLEVAAE